MNNIYEIIGQKIASLRNEFGGKGLTQGELAEKVGTTANTISRWELGVYKPSAEDLYKLAKIFSVSISVFFPDMKVNAQQHALMSATGDLTNKDFEDLIEYAKFRKARTILSHARSSKSK
jgi:transcriptional regulator with XRE-family HTH domain